MPIYINYGSIKGDTGSTNKNRQWIELNSFQWAVGRGTTSPSGGSADRQGSAPSVSEIVLTKASYHSLKNVNIVSLFGPPQPTPHRQFGPNRPHKKDPVPPWLKNVLVQLRPYMAPTGTIHLDGFQFDDRELSALAGVPVRSAE